MHQSAGPGIIARTSTVAKSGYFAKNYPAPTSNLLLNLHANHFLSNSSSTKKQIKVRRKAAKSCSLLKFLPMSAPSRCHQPSAPLPAPSALIGGKNWRKCATRLKKDRKYGEGRGKERLEGKKLIGRQDMRQRRGGADICHLLSDRSLERRCRPRFYLNPNC